MTQLVRMCKPEICSAIRSYSTQRYQRNYYETLNVSPNASQKDIKRAFIKLSKQLHPDISGKSGHADFVKLNEAYSILGRESTRRQYDLNLKSRHNPYYAHGCSQHMHYASQWEYEVRSAGGPWPPPKQKPNSNLGLATALLFLGFGMFHIFFLWQSMKIRKMVILKSMKLENQYHITRMEAKTNKDHAMILNKSTENR